MQVPLAHGEPATPEGHSAQTEKPPARTDRHGDPLPPGAVAGTGTVRLRPNAAVVALAYSADGKTLVSGGTDIAGGRVSFWDVRTGKQLREVKTGKRMVRALAFAPDGQISVLGAGPFRSQEMETAYLLDLTTGKERHTFPPSERVSIAPSGAFAPDGKIVATGHAGVHLWDTATGKKIRHIKEPEIWALALAFSPDNKLLASGDGTVNTGDPVDALVRLWDVATGRAVRTFTGLKDNVHSIAFSPDGKTLAASGGGNGIVLFWDVASGKELRRFENHPPVSALTFSPDGETLALASFKNQIVFWDVASGKEKSAARTDRHGDPLPPGAIVRLGTVRWRPNASVSALAYSPDGKTLVSGGSTEAYWPDTSHGQAALWDVRTGKQLREFNTGKRIVQAVAIAPDGQIMALGAEGQRNQENATASLWDLTTGKERHRFGGHTEMVWAAALTPDGKVAATACSRAIRLWDTATGKEIRQFKEPRTLSATLTFSPDGKLLASGEGTVNTGDPIDVFVQLWDVATGKVVRTFSGHKDFVFRVAFSPDGKSLASVGGRESAVIFWDVPSGKELRRFEKQDDAVSLAFSPDGQTLALANRLQLFFKDAASGKEQPQPADQSTAVGPVAFSPDGMILASGGGDGTTHLWDARTGAQLHRLAGSFGLSNGSIAFSPDGKTVAAPTEQGQVRLWEAATGKEQRRFAPPPGEKESDLPTPPSCRYVTFAQGGDVLAAASLQTIYLWDTATGKELRRLALEKRFTYVQSLVSSPDGKLLAAGDSSGTVYLWEVATGKLLRQLTHEKEKARVFTVAFSPDGKSLACALGNHKTRFWEVDTGKEIKVLEWPNTPKHDSDFFLAYSPTGGVIASAGRDDNVYLWDIATGKELGRFVGHQSRVNSVAFSPDGKRLASAGTDTTVLIWDVTDALRKARP